MKFSIFITLLCAFVFTSCKKGYTCYCTNPSGTFDYYNIHDTKKNATQRCKDYYDTHYASVPFNEVTCELKTK